MHYVGSESSPFNNRFLKKILRLNYKVGEIYYLQSFYHYLIHILEFYLIFDFYSSAYKNQRVKQIAKRKLSNKLLVTNNNHQALYQ